MSRLDAISPRHVVGLLVLLLLVAPFAAYTVPGVVGADESYIVLTGSMRPAIDPGAVVFVSAVPTASIGVDDVVTFDRGGDVPTTHRVIEIVERDGDLLFRTQGDANEDPDVGLVGADQVIGVVTFSIPYVGSVMTAANSQYGFVALVVVPFALLVLDVGYSAVVGRREDAAVDAELPAIYDPVQAAEAYYDAAADRLREAEALAGTGGVTSRDMTASMLLAAGLTTYAAWNAYWQFDSFGAPRAETMSVLSGALVCLAFLGYLRVTADDPTPTADEATGVSGEPTGAPVGVQTATDSAPVDSPASPAANGRAIAVGPPVRHAPSAAGNTPPAGVPQEEMHDAE